MQTTPSAIMSQKMSFIIIWKVAGQFVKPNNMTCGSKSPQFVRKAAFHSSLLQIQILLKPQQTSSLVKYFVPQSCMISLEMSGIGCWFLIATAFKAQ